MGSLTQRFFNRRTALAFPVLGVALAAGVIWLVRGDVPAAGAGDTSAVPAVERSWLVDDAPEPQQAALADLAVDRSEYVAAIGAERACMAGRGVATSEPEWQGNQLTYTFGGTPSRDGLMAPKAIYQECHELYGKHVAVGWGIGSSPAR